MHSSACLDCSHSRCWSPLSWYGPVDPLLRLESLVALVDHQVLRSLLCCFLRVGLASLWVLVGGGAWPPSAAWGFCAWGFASAAGLAWLFLGGSSPRGVGPAALWWVVVLWFGGLVVLLGPSGGAAGGRSWPPLSFPPLFLLRRRFPSSKMRPLMGFFAAHALPRALQH